MGLLKLATVRNLCNDADGKVIW